MDKCLFGDSPFISKIIHILTHENKLIMQNITETIIIDRDDNSD